MNQRFLVASLGLLLALSAANNGDAQASKVVQAKKQESREPPLKFELEIDGKKIGGEIGKSFSITGNFKNAPARIETFPYRTFNYADLEFRYPARHTWSADLVDPQTKAWTMTGSESSISVFVVSDNYSAEDYAKELIEEFDTDDFDQDEDLSWNLGGKKFKGIRLVFELEDFEYVYDIIDLPESQGNSRLLVLEDLDPDRNPESKEIKQSMKWLKQSFRVK